MKQPETTSAVNDCSDRQKRTNEKLRFISSSTDTVRIKMFMVPLWHRAHTTAVWRVSQVSKTHWLSDRFLSNLPKVNTSKLSTVSGLYSLKLGVSFHLFSLMCQHHGSAVSSATLGLRFDPRFGNGLFFSMFSLRGVFRVQIPPQSKNMSTIGYLQAQALLEKEICDLSEICLIKQL